MNPLVQAYINAISAAQVLLPVIEAAVQAGQLSNEDKAACTAVSASFAGAQQQEFSGPEWQPS